MTISESQYRELLVQLYDNTQDALFLIAVSPDDEFRFISNNSTHQEMTGITLAQIEGKTPQELLGQELGNTVTVNYRKCAEQRERIEYEERLGLPGGTRYWRTTLSPVIQDERTAYIIGSAMDVTDLKESEARFRGMVSNIPGVIYRCTADHPWRIHFVSDAIQELSGISAENLSAENARSFSDLIHPDDRDTVRESIASQLLRKKAFHLNYRVQHTDGGFRWVNDQGRLVFDRSGDAEFIDGVMFDITRQHETEEELFYINQFQSMIFDLSSEFLRSSAQNINESIQRMLQLTADFFDVDRSYLFRFSTDLSTMSNSHEHCRNNIEAQIELLQNVDSSGFPWWIEQLQQKAVVLIHDVLGLPDEATSERILFNELGLKSAMAVPVYDEQQITGFLGFDSVTARHDWNERHIHLLQVVANILSDAIHRAHIESDLNEARKRANRLNKAKSEFLAAMSHEIRTPMNAVIGFLDLLEESNLSGMQRQYAGNAGTAARNLLHIINDILDFSKIEAGKLELSLSDFNLRGLMNETIDIIRYQASQKKLELLMHIPSTIPETIHSDPNRIRQILINLLGNAVKFTETGEIELSTDYQSGTCIFTVRDTGIGMSEEFQRELFTAFSQASHQSPETYGGTGLGLHISQTIASRLGGTIEVDSRKGQGSVFTCQIPVRVPALSGNTTVAGDSESSQNSALQHGFQTCLLVDDNQRSREIIQKQLAEIGIRAITCSDALCAIEYIEKDSELQLVLIDSDMPYLNGLQTMQMIRRKLGKSPAEIRIVLLNSDPHEKLDAYLNAGMFSSLVKPATSTQLLHAITIPVVTSHSKTAETISTGRKNQTRGSGTETSASTEEPEAATNKDELRILVAEDIPMNMILIKTLMSSILPNAILIEVENGRKAVEIVETSEMGLDMILMDLHMPEMDGLEASRNIRQIEKKSGRRCPILAITANASTSERDRCKEAGMDGFISKPINRKSLMEAVLSLLPKKAIDAETDSTQSSSSKTKSYDQEIFDEQGLLEKISNNQELFLKLLKGAKTNYQEMATDLRQALGSADQNRIRELAHALRGSAGNLCFTRLYSAADQLETLLDSSNGTDKNTGKIESIKQASKALEDSLQELLTALSSDPRLQ